jgi:flagellar hook assembly protein FlgD
LSQNYPNPFNPQTSIRYALPQDAQVRLVIYNVLGQRVKTLVDESQSAGYKTEWWDGRDEKEDGVASGIYFGSFVFRLQV